MGKNEKKVTVTMTASQARQFGDWLGEQRVHTIPPELGRTCVAMVGPMRQGESVDVTDRFDYTDEDAQGMKFEVKE
jgi:hypothetical protein